MIRGRKLLISFTLSMLAQMENSMLELEILFH